MNAHLNPKNRMMAVVLFDASLSNPNGDPDEGNQPRTTPDGYGFVTAMCLKRKIRDHIQERMLGTPGYDLWVENNMYLNEKIEAGWEGVESTKTSKGKKDEGSQLARQNLLKQYVDLRMFGGVLNTGSKPISDSVRGPFVFAHAKSYDPIEVMNVTITRQAVTAAEKGKEHKTSEMGSFSVVSYGLYGLCLYYTPPRHEISELDMQVFWDAVTNLFEYDRSAARPDMNVRHVVVFTRTEDAQGKVARVSDASLRDLIKVSRRDGEGRTPNTYKDYVVEIPTQDQIPDGIELTVLL